MANENIYFNVYQIIYMAGGLIQLASKGAENLFLTDNPQITLFKMLYRRHTNFTTEPVPQSFAHTPNFGKKVSCVISRSGDLISGMQLVITLPKFNQLYNQDGSVDNITKFAWIRKIGFGIIKEIEIEIGGQSISKHYGEWLNIWTELVGLKNKDINQMIGNVEELTSFTSTKSEYILHVPLQFWFCRTSGLALPILCLQYNDVKVNLELNDVTKCYNITPTYYIPVQDDLVNLEPYEYIEQTIDGVTAAGIYSNYDLVNKRLYYTKVTDTQLQVINDANFYSYTEDQQNTIIDEYSIVGHTSHHIVCPQINTSVTPVYPIAHTHNTINNLKIKSCFLLVDYAYLDEDERLKFYKNSHEYLVEQLVYIGALTLDGVNRSVKMGLYNPCKLMVWTTQLNYLQNKNVNDWFNYTDSYLYNDTTPAGKSLIQYATIQMNSLNRMEKMSNQYYNNVQPYEYFRYNPNEGINIYSFSLFPEKLQPSGTCNMSKIDNLQINLTLSNIVSTTNPVTFKGYGLVSNVFKIVSGLGGLVFTN